MRNKKLCFALSVAALLCMAQPQIARPAVYEVSATGATEAAAEGNSRVDALRRCLHGMIPPEQAKEHAMALRPLFRKLDSLTAVEVLESGRQETLFAVRAKVTVDEDALRAELEAIPALAGLVRKPEQASSPKPEDIRQPAPDGGDAKARNGGTVEDAVAEALAAIPAKAAKVVFSAEEQLLVITDLEYTGSPEAGQGKGHIDQIRIEGFDDKMLADAAKALEAPDGASAPETAGQPGKTNLLMSGLTFEFGDISATLDKFAFSGVSIPQPAQLAALAKMADADETPDPGTVFRTLSDVYGGQPPFSLVLFENLKVWATKNDTPTTLERLSLAMDGSGEGPCKLDFSINALRPAPGLLGEFKEMVMRSAPEGAALDLRIHGASAASGSDAGISLKLRGQGSLELGCAVNSDVWALLKRLASEGEGGAEKLLSPVKLTSINLTYADSGLAALLLGIASKQFGTPPADLIAAVSSQSKELAASGNAFYTKLDGILTEQLANPGTISIKLAPGADIDVATFVMTAAGSPDKLPLEFSSQPGSRSMEEYLKE